MFNIFFKYFVQLFVIDEEIRKRKRVEMLNQNKATNRPVKQNLHFPKILFKFCLKYDKPFQNKMHFKKDIVSFSNTFDIWHLASNMIIYFNFPPSLPFLLTLLLIL